MINFKKSTIFTRETIEKTENKILHGCVLAVWGSPGTGKTTVAVKLAKYLADKKKNVVLVLCDMTAPISYTEFKPMYEKLHSGLLKIDFTELSDNRSSGKSSQSLHFQDSLDEPLEKQLGEVFISLFKIANEAAIARYIAEREYEKRRKEEQRLREIEAENLKEKQRTEARNQRRIKFHQNIDRHIEEWFRYQNIKKYIKGLNELLPTIYDPEEKEILSDYLLLLRDKAENANPIKDVIKEIKSLKDDES